MSHFEIKSMKTSIIYGTREGQTANIADCLEETVQGRGHRVMVNDARELPADFSLHDATAVI